jgi:hypothetical protein
VGPSLRLDPSREWYRYDSSLFPGRRNGSGFVAGERDSRTEGGRGWTLLAYPDIIGRRLGSLLNGPWVFAICLPIGFCAPGRFRIGAAGVLVALLLLIPAVTGAYRPCSVQWIGATLGLMTRSFARLDSTGMDARTGRAAWKSAALLV